MNILKIREGMAGFQPHWRKRFLWALAIFALYTLTGFFVLPLILKWQITKQAAAATQRQAAVRQVKFNPLALSLTVRGLALTETNGAPFVAFDEFYANFQLSSLFRWAWTFDKVHLLGPRAELVLSPDGRFNFSNLARGTNAPSDPNDEEPGGIPRLLVFSLLITNGQVNFTDFALRTPVKATFTPINLHLNRFTTKPDRESPYSFEASSDEGRTLQWAGSVTADPPASSGILRVTGMKLTRLAPYLEDHTRAQLTHGLLDVAGAYRFLLDTNGMGLVVSNLEVTVSSLQFKDPETGEAVVSVPRCEIKDTSLDWRARTVRVGSMVISEPASLVRRRSDGTINLLSLIAPHEAPSAATSHTPAAAPSGPPPSPPWTVVLAEGRLEGGMVELEDAMVSGPFRTILQPIEFRIRDFSTRTNVDAALEASVTTEMKETVKLHAACSIAPIRARGKIELAALDLKKYQAYADPFFRGRLAGRAAASVEFIHAREDGEDQVVVSNAWLRLSPLQVTTPETGEVVLSVPDFSIQNLFASLANNSARVGSIKSDGARVVVRRETDGKINLLNLLVSVTNQTSATTAPADNAQTNAPVVPQPEMTAAGWQVVVEEVALTNHSFQVQDKLTAKPSAVLLDQLALNLTGLQFPSNAPVGVELSTRVNERATVAARGKVHPYSPMADLELEVQRLVLGTFQPWIEPRVKLAVQSGSLDLRGRLHLSAPGEPGPKVKFEGGLSVTNLATADQVLLKEFVRWDDLTLDGAAIELDPNRVDIQQARFSGLKTSVIIGADLRPNFLAILAGPSQTNPPAKGVEGGAPAAPGPVVTQPSESTAAAAGEPAAATSFPMRLRELRFENAAIHFSDESIRPLCNFDIQQFSGGIKGISTEPGSVAELDLAGKVDESAPFGLRGTMTPLAKEPALDLVFTTQNLQLSPFTPYLEKYAGHPLLKGRLSLDVAYSVHDNQLEAKNSVRLDQFTLGPRNESPEATKLPVKLAVALLKDSEGRIQLDLPLTGRLDDPEFRVMPLILKVIVNVIVKSATSPFKLLGALVGGGEELSFVEFEPGTATWREGEEDKIAKLVKALQARPALSLEIQASTDPQRDRDAIALRLVRESIKNARIKELTAVGQSPGEESEFVPEPEHYERLLRARVVEEFGTNLTAALAELAARPATNQSAGRASRSEGKGLLRRAVDLAAVPFQGKNHPAKVARRQAKADAALLKKNPILESVTAESMELLLASRVEVPAESFLTLRRERAKVVQAELLKDGQLTADRLFLIAPGPPDPSSPGSASVNLSLN